MVRKMWRSWATELGEKTGETDKDADRVAMFRTLIILQAINKPTYFLEHT